MKNPIHEDAHVKANVTYKVFDKNGKLKYFKKSHNVVCDGYYDMVADRMAGGTDTLIEYGHCGTGNGGGASSTNLVTPCAESRTAIDSKTQGSGADLHKVTIVTTFGANICTGNLEECGLFPTITYTDNNMYLYDDTLSYTKGASDTLEVTWVITHANS